MTQVDLNCMTLYTRVLFFRKDEGSDRPLLALIIAYIYVIVSAVSVLLLSLSLAIFCYFK